MRKLIIALGISLLILCSIGLSSAKTVEFYSDPVGAALYVDGQYKGVTSSYAYGVLSVDLTETTHTYLFKKSGYDDAGGTVDVSTTSVVSQNMAIEGTSQDVFRCSFYTNPSGVDIYIDDVYRGTTSAYAFGRLYVDLEEGTHVCRYKKEGYYPGYKSITVNDEHYGFSQYLEPLPDGYEDTYTPPSSADDSSPAPIDDTTTSSQIAPTAVISTTQPSRTTVIFDSSSSFDSDGSIVARSWSIDSRSVSTATQYQLVTSDLSEGTHTIKLTVTDNDGLSSSSNYLVTVENQKITETGEVETTPEAKDDTTGNTGTSFVIPGFEFLPALIGLIAVAWAVRRGKYDN